MKYFTKEYIKECDCGEIQKLNTYFGKYDLVVDKEHYILMTIIEIKNYSYKDREKYIWLPTGDQLDEEIIEIIKKNYKGLYWNYAITFDYFNKKDDCFVLVSERFMDGYKPLASSKNPNPLITKIKLLKELIKNEKI